MLADFLLLLRNPHLRRNALRRWAGWTLATALGWAAAGYTGLPVGRIVTVEGGLPAVFEVAVNMGVIGALIGALTGAGQWLFLRHRPVATPWWLPGTALGWGLGLPLTLLANAILGIGLSAGLYGLWIGALVALSQWLLSRRLIIFPRRWLFANLLAFPLGFLVAGSLERLLLAATGGQWGLAHWQTAFTSSLAGAVVGLITGIALIGSLAPHPPLEPGNDPLTG